MAVQPVRAASLVDQAVAELRRLISSGEWPVDTKLPSEVKLSELLGVGRSTAREAVRALIADGQLRSQHGAGTFVVSATAESELGRQLRRAAVADVYEVRGMLEVQAGRLAAGRRTDADIAALRDALAARDQARDPSELVEADLALHRTVIASTHNPVLVEVFGSFLDALREAATAVVAQHQPREGYAPSDAGAEDHRAGAHHDLVAAISAGDASAAEEATRRALGLTSP